MIEVSEAVAAVLREAAPFEPQTIPLIDSLGLVLARDVHSDVDSPPFDKSLVDGFAVRLADCAQPLPVIDRQRPGRGFQHLLKRRDIENFIAILPHWDELSEGLNAIVHGNASPKDALGVFQDAKSETQARGSASRERAKVGV